MFKQEHDKCDLGANGCLIFFTLQNAAWAVGHNLDLRLIFKRTIAYQEWPNLGMIMLETQVSLCSSLLVEYIYIYIFFFKHVSGSSYDQS
jgi:hypothetical protein